MYTRVNVAKGPRSHPFPEEISKVEDAGHPAVLLADQMLVEIN